MMSASHESSSSVCTASPLPPSGPLDGQWCGVSITPSSEMYVELMMRRIVFLLVVGLSDEREPPPCDTCGHQCSPRIGYGIMYGVGALPWGDISAREAEVLAAVGEHLT